MLSDEALYKQYCEKCAFVYNYGYRTRYAKCEKTQDYISNRFSSYQPSPPCEDRAVTYRSTKKWVKLYFKGRERDAITVGGEKYVIETFWIVRQFFYFGDWLMRKLDLNGDSRRLAEDMDKAIAELEDE